MARIYLGNIDFVDIHGNLVRYDEWFDDVLGMPYTEATILQYGVGGATGSEQELSREIKRSWTGADIEVRKYRDRFGNIQTDERVVRLNTGDDDMPPDGRFG